MAWFKASHLSWLTTGAINVSSSQIEEIVFDRLLIEGPLTVESTTGRKISITDTVILGDVRISPETVSSVSLENVWIAGDLHLVDITFNFLELRDVRILGQLVLDNIKAQEDATIMGSDVKLGTRSDISGLAEACIGQSCLATAQEILRLIGMPQE